MNLGDPNIQFTLLLHKIFPEPQKLGWVSLLCAVTPCTVTACHIHPVSLGWGLAPSCSLERMAGG